MDRDQISGELRRLGVKVRQILTVWANAADWRRLVRDLLDLSAETHRFAASIAPTAPAVSQELVEMAAEMVELAHAYTGNGQPSCEPSAG